MHNIIMPRGLQTRGTTGTVYAVKYATVYVVLYFIVLILSVYNGKDSRRAFTYICRGSYIAGSVALWYMDVISRLYIYIYIYI